MPIEVLRYAAFTSRGTGGNPAGVVLDAGELAKDDMQRIATQIGYSETAFVVRRANETNVYEVRFFTPVQEVPFCGHATIAAAVALAERTPASDLQFHTPSGLVAVQTQHTDAGIVAELTSVAPRIREPEPALLSATLAALRWSANDLDSDCPPCLANAGAEHLILVVRSHARLRDLNYDFDRLAAIMQDHGLVTCQLIWPERVDHFHSRNPFAGNGVVEDPATGAAAAAFGGYLRELGKIGMTAEFTISQGIEMGRPSLLMVSVIEGEPGVRVKGAAASIES
ncbi:MAG TPA: PhzF family phenazine biosynthesis protein [Propionibacteriaceae bacterium]|nr:PhzF family phenazine biosynthesis protein [Propionibacteriaceae bacterium]